MISSKFGTFVLDFTIVLYFQSMFCQAGRCIDFIHDLYCCQTKLARRQIASYHYVPKRHGTGSLHRSSSSSSIIQGIAKMHVTLIPRREPLLPYIMLDIFYLAKHSIPSSPRRASPLVFGTKIPKMLLEYLHSQKAR